MSNLKQISLGMMQYTQDWDERLPMVSVAGQPSRTWRAAVYPYIKTKQIYQCPNRNLNLTGADGFSTSYAANTAGAAQAPKGAGVFVKPGQAPLALAAFDDPQNLITLCEVDGMAKPDFDIDDSARFGPNTQALWAGHHGDMNVALLDGHVKAIRPSATDAPSVSGGGTARNLWYRHAATPLSANGAAVLRNADRRFPVSGP